MARQQVPKFGNWENEEDVPYTVYFENAANPKPSKDAKGGSRFSTNRSDPTIQSVSPHHSISTARPGGKASSAAISSPSWERKALSEDAHAAVAPSTPGRSRLRSVTRGDDTPDNSPAVPKFGDWDESDPASGEGYSQIFSRVREEKHNVAGKVPMMPTEASYINGQKRIATATSKGCGCFPWSR